MLVEVVAAMCYRSRGIGFRGSMPWHLPNELKQFAKLTCAAPPHLRNVVLMGRNTWDSLPQHAKPLKNRINVILSSSPNITLENDNVMVFRSFEEALNNIGQRQDVHKVFIIGGAQIYEQALRSCTVSKLHITEIYHDFECDVFFPEYDISKFKQEAVSPVMFEGDVAYQYFTLSLTERAGIPVSCKQTQMKHEELQYLDLVKDILESGIQRSDRTGVGTLAVCGRQMRFSLRNDVFPLLTTKKVFWRGVLEELLWFVSGSTNANILKDKKIHIWDGNSSKEFLTKIGLGHREEGDLGPVYGFQWRHFGAEYLDMHASYQNSGIDQLAQAIEMIKTSPESRRIIVTAWNPSDLPKMALPPCHMMMQFFVMDGELSCLMYQRSCDVGLGVPFNIASYALLTRMVAQVCSLRAGEFIHVLGDAHIYLDHVDALKQQLLRKPFPFPTLRINPDKKNIDDFVAEDFVLENYQSHKTISMKMAV